jgi:glycine/D-amino acid oxidase-like deaminating enzyme
MAQVFHRASGRAWHLRQRSLALWEHWLDELRELGHPVELRRGLLQLAASSEELSRQQLLCQQRQAMGLPLAIWGPDQLAALSPQLPQGALGGLWSAADAQVDPPPLLAALLHEGQRLGLQTHNTLAVALQPVTGNRWTVHLKGWTSLTYDAVVVCAGHGTTDLLEPLGFRIPLAPVLGQALELDLGPAELTQCWVEQWPAAITWQGINLVLRPGGRLWLGATLEPGQTANPQALQTMADLNGHAPAWLQQATVVRQWRGLRMRPMGRGAPWLEALAPGLLLAGGHYRNGLLLAPATATWIAEVIESS